MLEVLVKAYTVATLAQDAGQCRLADLDRLPAHVGAVQLQQVEGEEECPASCRRLRSVEKIARPRSSQHTTSPSIRQDRTLKWFTASTMSGKPPDHQTIEVVLDLVNPVGPRRRLVGVMAGRAR